MKQHLRTALIAALAFAAGIGLARLPIAAFAAAAPLQPAAIDLTTFTPDNMPPPAAATPNLHSKTLVVTDGMTGAIQIGTVAKHYHANVNEIQVVLAGTGTEWLNDKQVTLKPGMMLIIPPNTNHGGTTQTAGSLTIVSFKTPPQDPADIHFVP
jgi:mannose-6-phosphate isomerase-like protein (cupin superfamily)